MPNDDGERDKVCGCEREREREIKREIKRERVLYVGGPR